MIDQQGLEFEALEAFGKREHLGAVATRFTYKKNILRKITLRSFFFSEYYAWHLFFRNFIKDLNSLFNFQIFVHTKLEFLLNVTLC